MVFQILTKVGQYDTHHIWAIIKTQSGRLLVGYIINNNVKEQDWLQSNHLSLLKYMGRYATVEPYYNEKMQIMDITLSYRGSWILLHKMVSTSKGVNMNRKAKVV